MNELLKTFRRDLHAHPDLSGQEHGTCERIRTFLQQNGIDGGQQVGETGLLYRAAKQDGPRILVRVDIDALPIQETNDFAHASTRAGISHKCGHDGHAAIGTGLLLKLQSEPINDCSISVLFQPAEEIGEGARAVLSDQNFDVSHYDYALALHNIPGAALHQILWKKGGFTPAVHSIVIRLFGKTSHAAQPGKGHNPGYAIADIIDWAREHEERDEQQPEYALVTPVFSTLGSRDYGISAGYGEVHFTLRSWEQARLEAVTAKFLAAVEAIALRENLRVETQKLAVFAANQNDDFVVEQIVAAAHDLNLDNAECPKPFAWGEDFGLFTQHIPGAMFGLGSGIDRPALHNPDYDYPDEITSTGVNMFHQCLRRITQRNARNIVH